MLSLLFLFIFVNSTKAAKPKYRSKRHEKLKSKQTCKSSIHCNDTITINPFTSTVICIDPSLNTDQLILSSPYHNFGSVTADIVDGSYNENIFIAPDSTKYLTKYYGFDIKNYDSHSNIQIPLRIMPPAINITHDITVGCMKCSRDICEQTIISNDGEVKRFCVPTHISAENPSYISQFTFICDVGSCLIRVYDYTNLLQFTANIGGEHEHKIEFNDFNIEEAYTIEFAGISNKSELKIECYDPLFHTAYLNNKKLRDNNHNDIMRNAQELVMLLTMVAIMGLVMVSYLQEKHRMPWQTQAIWNDL